jgi:hypothetical protein
LPPEQRTHADVLACKLAIMTAFGQWEAGLELLNLLEPSFDDQHRRDCARFCHAYACLPAGRPATCASWVTSNRQGIM